MTKRLHKDIKKKGKDKIIKKSDNTWKIILGLLIIFIVVLVVCLVISFIIVSNKKKHLYDDYTKVDDCEYSTVWVDNVDDYIEKYKSDINNIVILANAAKTDNSKKYLDYIVELDGCSENIKFVNDTYQDDKINLYFEDYKKCGTCSSVSYHYLFEVDDIDYKRDVAAYYKVEQNTTCVNDNMVVSKKPIIYIYPEEDMDLTIKLGNASLLTHTYPKYNNIWNVHVSKDGNIYDYDTKKNYYALYWEAEDNSKIDISVGFVVKGSDTVSFLEEKLAYLGLNEKEINEFIIYWIDKLEDNKYNYIYFRTTDEINEFMPLEFSKNPDTLIRIIMDYKPLNEKIDVNEQQLTKVERSGFTVVEWGGREIN